MTLIRRLRDHVIWQQQSLIRAQRMLIQMKNEEIQATKAAALLALETAQLEHTLDMQGVVCAWLISSDRPEIDLRDDLVDLERRLADDVAVLEEHIV